MFPSDLDGWSLKGQRNRNAHAARLESATEGRPRIQAVSGVVIAEAEAGGNRDHVLARKERRPVNLQPSFALVTTLHCVATFQSAIGIGVGS
jgi:hypothetical protein